MLQRQPNTEVTDQWIFEQDRDKQVQTVLSHQGVEFNSDMLKKWSNNWLEFSFTLSLVVAHHCEKTGGTQVEKSRLFIKWIVDTFEN